MYLVWNLNHSHIPTHMHSRLNQYCPYCHAAMFPVVHSLGQENRRRGLNVPFPIMELAVWVLVNSLRNKNGDRNEICEWQGGEIDSTDTCLDLIALLEAHRAPLRTLCTHLGGKLLTQFLVQKSRRGMGPAAWGCLSAKFLLHSHFPTPNPLHQPN